MTCRFGIGIVGAGRIFEQHARAYAALGTRARLLAVADVDDVQLRQATSRHFIPFAFHDVRALIDRADIDIVTVCTPPVLHETVVVQALEAGKFVVCEKPLAHTLASADRILTVARRHPGRLSVVHQFRYLPEVRRTIWLRDENRLGRLLFGRFSRYARYETPGKGGKPGKAAKPGKARSGWWGHWATAGGGAAMTQLIHELDLMCHVFGQPVTVTAAMATLKEPIESEDTCAATVRFANGALVACYGTMTSQRTSNAFDVFGEQASVHLPWGVECVDVKARDQMLRDVLAKHPDAPEPGSSPRTRSSWSSRLWNTNSGNGTPMGTAHTPYLTAVLDAIVQDRPLPVGPDEARSALELCTAIYTAALTGETIELPLMPASRYYEGFTTADYDGREGSRTGYGTVVPLVPGTRR